VLAAGPQTCSLYRGVLADGGIRGDCGREEEDGRVAGLRVIVIKIYK